MLRRLLEKTHAEIEALVPRTLAPVLAKRLEQIRPDLLSDVRKAQGDSERADLIFLGFAVSILDLIREIPRLSRLMLGAAESDETNEITRIGVLSSLAYLVKPRDLIPDDAPGGYGFLDDAILIRASLDEFGEELAELDFDRALNSQALALLTAFIAPHDVARFQSALDGLATVHAKFGALPEAYLDAVAAQLHDDPLHVDLIEVPAHGVRSDTKGYRILPTEATCRVLSEINCRESRVRLPGLGTVDLTRCSLDRESQP